MATGKMTLKQLMSSLDMTRVPDDHALDTTLMPTLAPRIRRTRGGSSLPPKPQRKTLAPPAGEDRDSHQLRVKGPLAEGGMGTIKLAEQSGLNRDVALKTLRDPFLEPAFAARLLREARILGLVEHPNVVPLYGLATDERNSPVLIMRRIEGVAWRLLIRDPEHPAFPADQGDPLAWHLQVLMRVCDAVEYAHSRGVLHLDLKPENVMIGPFRETILLDWGVAVCTEEKYRGRLPMADEVREILGTPAYLAPEMVDVGRQTLGPRTDVYLLGATLFEILTGHPPHRGENLQEMLYAAYDAQIPELPDDVPTELAQIVQRAMHPDAEKRFPTPNDLRRALRDFLAHRSAASLATKAEEELEELRSLIRARGREPTLARVHATSDSRNSRIQRVFGRCRFGFAEAIRLWPDNESAREHQSAALLLMARYHLDRGEAASAETLLTELGDDPRATPLRQEAEAQRKEAIRLERIRLEEQQDPGRQARGKLLLGAMVIAITVTLSSYTLSRFGLYEYHWWNTLAFDLALPVFFGVGGLLARRTALTNRRSRRALVALVVIGLLAVLLRMTTLAMGLRDLRSTALELMFFGSGAVLAGILNDRRFYIAAPGLFLGGILVLFATPHAQAWLALSLALGPLPLAIAWIRSGNSDAP
ncbi:MAG: serine/threonine-protein kinase [Myxococcota bacterium]